MSEAQLIIALGAYEALARASHLLALSDFFAKTKYGPFAFAVVIGIFVKHIIEEARR